MSNGFLDSLDEQLSLMEAGRGGFGVGDRSEEGVRGVMLLCEARLDSAAVGVEGGDGGWTGLCDQGAGCTD